MALIMGASLQIVSAVGQVEALVADWEVGDGLVAHGVRRYSAAEWDASSERKRIARWQCQAVAMRDGGYRRLLNGY